MSSEVYLIFKKFHIKKSELEIMVKEGIMNKKDYEFIIENNLVEED